MPMIAQVPEDLSERIRLLDAYFLDSEGRLRIRPAWEWKALEPIYRLFWCMARRRYGLTTRELVAFLRWRIGSRRALEICAGLGDLGLAVGIHSTDSAIQTTPTVRAYFRALGHRPITPPPHVERREACAAVAKHRPQVVIASWGTQIYEAGTSPASVYGVDEEALLRMPWVEEYILIGTQENHGARRIVRHPHERWRPNWLVSRTMGGDDCIWIWKGGGK